MLERLFNNQMNIKCFYDWNEPFCKLSFNARCEMIIKSFQINVKELNEESQDLMLKIVK